MERVRTRTLVALGAGAGALALALYACGRSTSSPTPAPASASAPRVAGAPPLASAPRLGTDHLDLVNELPRCEVRHRGLSFDFGTPQLRSRRGWSSSPSDASADVEREGATFERLFARRASYDFWLDEPEEKVTLSVRVHGGVAQRLGAEVDGQGLGSAKLTTGETRVVDLPGSSTTLARGRHTLTVRLSGGRATGGNREPYAELDWARLGPGDELSATYSAPTLKDIVVDEPLDGQPRRSIALRAASSVRCTLRPAADARLRVALGYWGDGRGAAELRVLRDGEAPVTLAERRVTGGPGATWTPIDVALGSYASELIVLELGVTDASQGGRVLFGDPVIEHARRELPALPRASTVVLVIAASMERRLVPPWGPIEGLGALGELARGGAAFSGYRAPITVPAGAVASMLTGLDPRAHTLEDPAARLPANVRTIAETVKEASGRAAMFTGVPTTSTAFGFESGWDRFEFVSPVQDLPATEPYLRAARWLDQELAQGPARRFVVIHERGLHPPWDLDGDAVAKLPPEEYEGVVDARRGGILLAGVRGGSDRKPHRLEPADWTRLRAIETAVMLRQNAGLAKVLDTLERHDAWDDALVVFVGDVASGELSGVPFEPAGPLTEDRLVVPLLVKFPQGKFAGVEAKGPATAVDIARTVLRALDLRVPDSVGGVDLWSTANGISPVIGRPLVATLGDTYATLIGTWMLRGRLGRAPRLCALDVDPSCVSDVLGENPIAAQALWRWTYDVESAELLPGHKVMREPADIDLDTAAALTVWGDLR
ncbi:MAG: sulfatase-like hydrolase/transferase [Sorangiineae bacterium]|nr:sulfatase-like hydrolase/transferase [Sorangiineae bacterium]